MNISKSIRLAMVITGLDTNPQVAARLGIKAGYFSRFKNGSNSVNEKMLQKLADAFNMKVSEFIALGESK